MITQDNVPNNAVKTIYTSLGGERREYYTWENKGKKGGWYWSASGNGGLEPTENGAREAARIWIRDGVSSIGRSRQGNLDFGAND